MNEYVDLSRLFFFANRRCVKEELKTVAKILGPDIPVKVDRESKPLKEFLSGMREETLRWNSFTTPDLSNEEILERAEKYEFPNPLAAELFLC